VVFHSEYVGVTIRRQKNDPNGKGMICWVPFLKELGRLCPAGLLRQWCTEQEIRTNSVDDPLFCVITSPQKAISYDYWRKTVVQTLKCVEVGTHSLRKGGAHWYKHVAGANPDSIQTQGGWSTPAVMEGVYTRLSPEECRHDLARSARSAFSQPPGDNHAGRHPGLAPLDSLLCTSPFADASSSDGVASAGMASVRPLLEAPSAAGPSCGGPDDLVWWSCDLVGCCAVNKRIYATDPYRSQRKYNHLHSVGHAKCFLEALPV
jgi:hypothetical protein